MNKLTTRGELLDMFTTRIDPNPPTCSQHRWAETSLTTQAPHRVVNVFTTRGEHE